MHTQERWLFISLIDTLREGVWQKLAVFFLTYCIFRLWIHNQKIRW